MLEPLRAEVTKTSDLFVLFLTINMIDGSPT
jgi:hypothetical protein